ISNSILKNTLNNQMACPERLHRIRLPINALHYGNISSEAIVEKSRDQIFNILCVTRVEPEKGVLSLFDMQKLLSDNNDFTINVAGDSSDKGFFQRALSISQQTNKISKCKINFLGQKNAVELVQLYKKSHLLISPSQVDTWGLALVESMAYGLPVFTLPSPGSTEIFGDLPKVCGGIEPDVYNLSQRILGLNRTREQYIQLSTNALENSILYEPAKVSDDILCKIC
ncbi:MAG: Glycosyl transferase group 1, partial [Candidatus Woesebacteria bacterium GW2011_GWB1_38_5b]